MPPFFVLGVMLYRTYHETFEKRGSDAGVRGLAFFFGIAFIIEVGIIMAFGVDQRTVQAFYIGKSVEIFEIRIPMRMVVAFAMALLLSLALTFYLSKTFLGRAIRAVAQDEGALRLMGADPVAIKQWAFGIATAVVALAGALLIIVQPVEPTLDRAYIGRTFCVVVMAGLGSMSRNAAGRHHPGRGRDHRAHHVRRLVGAGHLLHPAADRPGRPAAGPVRAMTMRGFGRAAGFWIGAAGFIALAFAMALTIRNEYAFFAGFVVLQFIVLATAWNILGGYAGYVNFGTSAFFGVGVYTAVFAPQGRGGAALDPDRSGGRSSARPWAWASAS